MHKLQINKFSETGLQEAEVRALDRISENLPPNWLAYANFEFRDRKIGNREIDLVLVTENVLILVELKNWNGRLRGENGQWLLNGQNRGRSPVEITDHKCKLLKEQILKKEKHNIGHVYVVPVVVLCGTATPDYLEDGDRGFTCTLDDFCRIGDASAFNKLFPSVRSRKHPLNKEKESFNRVFSKQLFDPRRLRYSGYIPDGEPIFVHGQSIYKEFIAKHETTPGYWALLRTWNLKEFPTRYSTEKKWKELVRREPHVIGYLNQHGPRDLVAKSILYPNASTPEDEFSSQYFELYGLPPRAHTIENYVRKSDKRLSFRERIELVRAILNVFSEVHDIGVAHRDISDSSVWTGDDLEVAVSRWTAAAYPEAETVGPVREFLHSGRSSTPEDVFDEESTGYSRDVFLLGTLASFILTGAPLKLSDGVAEWKGFPQDLDTSPFSKERISHVMDKALEFDPKARFRTATDFLDEFDSATELAPSDETLFRDELRRFQVPSIPYVEFPLTREISRSEAHIYESHREGIEVVVKVWASLSIDDSDSSKNRRLLDFLGAADDLRNAAPQHLPRVVDFGLSPVGCFIVYEKVEGAPILEALDADQPTQDRRLGYALSVVRALETLHSIGIAHRDVKPENILIEVRPEPSPTCLKIIDCPDIESCGMERSTPAYAPTATGPVDAMARDRYGVLLTAAQVLGGTIFRSGGQAYVDLSSTEFAGLSEGINQLLAEPDTLHSSEPILSIFEAEEQRRNAPTVPEISVGMRNTDKSVTLYPDESAIYVFIGRPPPRAIPNRSPALDPEVCFEVTLLGVNGALQLVWNYNLKRAEAGRLIRQSAKHRPHLAQSKVAARFNLEPSARNDFTALNNALGDKLNELIDAYAPTTEPVPSEPEEVEVEPEAQVTDESKPAATVPESSLPIDEIWKALIDAEEDVLPEVTVTDDPESAGTNRSALIVPYETVDGRPIEFDRNEPVLVAKRRADGQYQQVGELVHGASNREALGISLTRPAHIQPGDTLQLNSKLAKASYDKRRYAIDAILNRKSACPDLLDWISGERNEPERAYAVDENELESIRSRHGLNESQIQAIGKVLRCSPLGLVQGPPGTGKTHFISVLIEYLLDKGAQNILLTSQSHEAVNNCLEKLVSLYSDEIDALDAVRVGPIEMCSPTAKKYHIDNIQSRYRKRFTNNMRWHVETASQSLGLPPEFVSQYTRLKLATKPLLDDYKTVQTEISAEDLPRERGVQRLESLRAALNGKTQRISRRFPQVGDEEDVFAWVEGMERQLAERHEIQNRDAISRLDQLIQIAFEWNDALTSPHGNFGEFLTRTKRIVIGTCVGIGRKALHMSQQARDWVIVDEAARCSAGELAVPAQTAKRLVLVGDHKQLPPLYTRPLLNSAASALGLRFTDPLEVSDFRRSVETQYGTVAGQLLTEQYRMRPAIGEMVSEVFYDGALITRRAERDERDHRYPEALDADVTWYDTANAGRSGYDSQEVKDNGETTSSYVNKVEVRAILDVLRDIAEHDEESDSLRDLSPDGEPPIGVICAYAAQKRELLRQFRQRAFPESFQDLVKVDTVDSYQGKQNAIIILSLVRNNANYDTGFLSRPERINVAVSRAMEKLVLVGSTEMWINTSAPPGKLIEYIRARTEAGSRYSITDATQ